MRIEQWLRRQDGVISLAQATAAGLSPRAVRDRVASGRWERLHPTVYRATDRPLTDTARVRAVALWAGPRTAVSGLAAAWWLEIADRCPPTIEVTAARDRQPGRRPGVRVRRRTLSESDLVVVRSVCVTDLPLTALEAAVALGPDGAALLDRALQRQVRFPAVYRAHCRNLGRYGSRAAGALLVAAADRAASEAERLLVRVLRGAGLTGWRLGYVVGGFVLDVAFAEARVAIEVDGWAWHSDALRRRQDLRRQNAVVLAGWTVLRFSWDDLAHRPRAVLAEITMALATGPVNPHDRRFGA
jgi:very-short-patch-repair endonuclease